jgi:hypothetical protein
LHGALDGIEEANELLVPVPLRALTDDRAVEHIECREQCGRAVALIVIMGHRPGPGWVRSSTWMWLFSFD